MVMIEAMACGCPVISFDRGAAPEIVVHEQNGFLVRDVAEMISTIPRLDEIDRDALRPYVEQHFSARVMADHYVEVYEKVIAEKRNKAKARGRRAALSATTAHTSSQQ